MNKFAKVNNQGTSLNIALLHYRRWSSYVKQEEGQFVLLTFSHCTLISEESCWVGWQFVRERLRVAIFLQFFENQVANMKRESDAFFRSHSEQNA